MKKLAQGCNQYFTIMDWKMKYMRINNTFFQIFPDTAFLAVNERNILNTKKKQGKRLDKYLSIILDGMDQAKTNLPHFHIKSREKNQSKLSNTICI